jgi:exo-1,4-beta-D-glucosaminidase
LRLEITKEMDGEEVLPVLYEDNYVTLFPNESRSIQATFKTSNLNGQRPALRWEGYNVSKKVSSFAGAGKH